jgi:hypothetical protein
MDPDLVKTLPRFLTEYCNATLRAAAPQDLVLDPKKKKESVILPSAPYGLDHLKVSKISLPFGAWGGQVGELWQRNFTAFLKELEPMMMEATLSGLVMDQYHRQCQQELQQLVEAASSQRAGFESNVDGQQYQLSNFDQRLCTHKAWHHLIHQLIKDASLTSSDSLQDGSSTSSASSSSSTPFSRAIGQSPLQNGANYIATPVSSIKEMRSYNNIYIVCVQKIGLEELKQQQLFKHLEEEVLSPNPNHNAPSTFGTVATAGAGALEGAMSIEQVFEQAEFKEQHQQADAIQQEVSSEHVKSENVVVAPSNSAVVGEAEEEEEETPGPQYIELEAESSDEGEQDNDDSDENTIEILNRVSLEDIHSTSEGDTEKRVEEAMRCKEDEEEAPLQMLQLNDNGNDDDTDIDNSQEDDKEEVLLMLAPETQEQISTGQLDGVVLGEDVVATKQELSAQVDKKDCSVEESSKDVKTSHSVVVMEDDIAVIEVEEKRPVTVDKAMPAQEVANETSINKVDETAQADENEEEEEEEEDEDEEEGLDAASRKSTDGSLVELRKQKKLKKKSKSKKRRSKFL